MSNNRQLVHDLLQEYNRLEQEKLRTLKILDEALNNLTDEKIGICVPDPLPVHIYAGIDDNIDVVKELADDCKLNCTTVFDDGGKYYVFTVDGVNCIAIGPKEEK